MSLFLVSPGLDLSVELYLPTHLEDALARQWERLNDRTARDAFCQRLTRQLETLLPDAMDWDIKEPTTFNPQKGRPDYLLQRGVERFYGPLLT